MILLMAILLPLSVEYVDLQRKFIIAIPDGYQFTTVHNGTPFLHIGQDLMNGSYPNLNIVQTESSSAYLLSNIDSIVEQLSAELPEYVLLKKEIFIFQEFKNGLKLFGKWNLNGKELRNIQYYFLMNDFLYIVTGTSLASNFDKDLPIFEKTVLSIKRI